MLIYRLFLEIMQKLNQSVFSGLSQQIFSYWTTPLSSCHFYLALNLSIMDRLVTKKLLSWKWVGHCRDDDMYAEKVPLGWSFWSGQAGYLIWKERVFVQDIIRFSNFQKRPKLTLSRPIIQFYGFLFEASPHLSFWLLIVFHLAPGTQ